VVLCNEKTGEYGPLLPLAQQISLKSDRLLGTDEDDTEAPGETWMMGERTGALQQCRALIRMETHVT
jgi:hypothetical protein